MEIKIAEREKIRIINSDDVFAIMRKVLLRENKIDRNKEHFWMVGLAANSRLLFIELVSIGGFTSTSVNPREAFQVAVHKGAVSAIMVHNHSDDMLMPSDADKDLTDRFIQAGRILNVKVVNHLIITTQTFFSFQINGVMEELGKSLKWVPPYEIDERIQETRKKSLEEGMERGTRKGIREGKIRGREEGLQEGEKKRSIEIARALLSDGMAIDTVSKYSGLPEEEIRKL
uniref:DNA repair protein RadC n=1 Tax=Candidatus Kentrum sp. TUN TaxID=2126343 RepID=A0A451ADD3_9GAMM|nr:MAG: DNA repair protein RadC [Candidatus Kentron sp. TUN]